MSVQLVGLTAIVIFCFSALSISAYSRALWRDWAMLASVTNKTELFIPVLRVAFLCVASAVTFVALLRATLHTATRVAIIYLGTLLAFQGWHVLSWWYTTGQWQGHLDAAFFLALITKFAYLAWLSGLLIKVWPNYSLKRTAVE